MIRQALPRDIGGIMAVVEESRKIMQAGGNFQWDDNYPLQNDFERDISGGTLYIADENGVAVGLICINSDEPREYSNASWQGVEPVLVIHRMAVSPDFRGRGIAGELLGFAEQLSHDMGAQSLRTDTFSGNIPMNTLFLKHEFRKTGVIELKGKKQQPFYCYEKITGRVRGS